MRLISSVGTAMDSQGAALNECLIAGLVITRVRALIGVYSVMTLEVGLAIETLRNGIAISLCPDIGEGRKSATPQQWEQGGSPWGIPGAIRTEKDEQPCRRNRVPF